MTGMEGTNKQDDAMAPAVPRTMTPSEYKGQSGRRQNMACKGGTRKQVKDQHCAWTPPQSSLPSHLLLVDRHGVGRIGILGGQ